jgi:hypothetical protein
MGAFNPTPITPDDIAPKCALVLNAGLTPLVQGPPGTAKNAQMHTLASLLADGKPVAAPNTTPKKGEFGLWFFVAGNYEAVEFSLPYVENGRQRRAMLEGLPMGDVEGLFVLDEVGQNPDLFKIVAQLVHERRLNSEYRVPDKVRIVLLTNRAEDRAGASKLFTHLVNRVVTLEVKPSLEGFLKYHGANLVPEIAACLRWLGDNGKGGGILSTFDPKEPGPFASLRSWTMLNALMLGGLDPIRDISIVQGTVGLLPGAEFRTVYKTISELPADPDAMLDNPDKYKDEIAKLAHSPTVMAAFTVVMMKRVDRDPSLYGKAVAVMERISSDSAVAFTRLSLNRTPLVADQPAYGAFVAKHKYLHF